MIAENLIILLVVSSYYGIGGALTKAIHEKLATKGDFVGKVSKEGLYHITDADSAKK